MLASAINESVGNSIAISPRVDALVEYPVFWAYKHWRFPVYRLRTSAMPPKNIPFSSSIPSFRETQ
jgi:hypothetical protein